jgi:hypothetical protein
MTRFISPKRPGVPKEYLPDPAIDRAVVRSRLATAELLDKEEAVCAFLDNALADYRRDQIKHKAVAWPGKITALLERVQSAIIALKLTSEAEGTILRATSVSPFAYADAGETLTRLGHDLRAILKETGEPIKGGGQAVRYARQRDLAERFWRGFLADDWPVETSPNSLMPQLLRLVLETAGEGRGTLKKLLNDTKPNT